MIRNLSSKCARLFRRAYEKEEGNASIEFVFLFPIFLVLLVSSIESGIMTLRAAMLDRAVDLQVRDLRLGLSLNVTHDELRDAICADAAIIPDCQDVLLLELVEVPTEGADAWSVPDPQANCVDRTGEIEPVVNFSNGQQNEMMIVRACVVVDPLFPTFGFRYQYADGTTNDIDGLGRQMPLDRSGGYAIVSSSAFVNEPN